MPLYEEHREAGIARAIPFTLAVFVLAVFVTSHLLAGVVAAVAAGSSVILGAVFPDVDHHAAKPHRKLKKFIAYVFMAIAAFCYLLFVAWILPNYSDSSPISGYTAYQLGLGILVVPLAGTVGSELVTRFRPKHRGITHTREAGLVGGTVLAAGIWLLGAGAVAESLVLTIAFAAGVGFFVGVIEHLKLDGIIGEERAEVLRSTYSKLLAPVYAAFGMIAAISSRAVSGIREWFWRQPLKTKILLLIAGGVLVGIVVWALGAVFGSGSDAEEDHPSQTFE